MLFIVGVVVIFIAVFAIFGVTGGRYDILLQPGEFFTITGAAVGAYLISNRIGTVKHTIGLLKSLMGQPRYNKDSYLELLSLLYTAFKLAKTKGMLALEQHVENPRESQLFQRFPEYQEGDLTKVKSAVVSRKTCARFSQEIGLGDFLFLGRGVHTHGAMPLNILANVFESLVAAIYLDGGIEAAKAFLLEMIVPEIELAADGGHGNHKSSLQQMAQRRFGDTPRYRVLDEQGPDHNKCFKVTAEIARHRYPPAWGINKKEAEQKAAMNALAAIRGEEIHHPTDY